jgi:hypothetical protein
MSMRRLSLFAGLALAVSMLLPGSALAAVGGSDLPVIGSHAGSCPYNLVTLQGHCVSTGTGSHFGVSTMEADVQLAGLATGSGYSGTWTLTVANGDQMFGTVTGTSSTTDGVHLLNMGTWVSSGGTGRFEDASATFHDVTSLTIVSVEGVIATFAFETAIVGRLSY